MRRWRRLAQAGNLVILLALPMLFVFQAYMVFSNIAQYESRGLVADNDLGQRGLALSAIFLSVPFVLALLSRRYLLRASVLGFVFHAVLWLVLLLVGLSSWFVFGRELGGVEVGLLFLCLAGTGYGVICAGAEARFLNSGVVTR